MAAVRISYKSLLQAGDSSGSVDASLNQAIEDAFGNGPDALGVIVIEGESYAAELCRASRDTC